MVPNPICADIEAISDILSCEERFNFRNSPWRFPKPLKRALASVRCSGCNRFGSIEGMNDPGRIFH
jgi:hypothetical protein